MTTILTLLIGIFGGAVLGAGMMCVCRVSGRADDCQACYEARRRLRRTLAPWVRSITAGLVAYDGAAPYHIIACLAVTAEEGRALMGAFGELPIDTTGPNVIQ